MNIEQRGDDTNAKKMVDIALYDWKGEVYEQWASLAGRDGRGKSAGAGNTMTARICSHATQGRLGEGASGKLHRCGPLRKSYQGLRT
jgi:hypothetical protein